MTDTPVEAWVAKPRILEVVPVLPETANFITDWLQAQRFDILYNRGALYTYEWWVQYKDTYTATQGEYITRNPEGVFEVMTKEDLERIYQDPSTAVVEVPAVTLIDIRRIMSEETPRNTPVYANRGGTNVQVGWASALQEGVRTIEFGRGYENLKATDLVFGDDPEVKTESVELNSGGAIDGVLIPGEGDERTDFSAPTEEPNVPVVARESFEAPAAPVQVDAVPETAPVPSSVEIKDVSLVEAGESTGSIEYSDEDIAEFKRLEAEEAAEKAAGRHADQGE